jgi:hypothetical protein
MGGMAVRVPGDVITRGLPSDRSPAATGDEAAPATLTFSYSSSMGEIEFRN